MGMIVKDNKEVDISELLNEMNDLEDKNKLENVIDNNLKEKIELDIINGAYTDLQLDDNYNIAYSLGKLFIELILKDDDNVKKVLEYTYNLSDFLAVFSMKIVLKAEGMKKKLIKFKSWVNWAKKYRTIVL